MADVQDRMRHGGMPVGFQVKIGRMSRNQEALRKELDELKDRMAAMEAELQRRRGGARMHKKTDEQKT